MKLALPAFNLHRLVPSRFPSINVFEGIYATAEDLQLAFLIEGLTNDRLLQEADQLDLVPADQWVWGEGASPVMAAFTHIGKPSRFTDGTYGVYYGGDSLDTALAEVKHGMQIFLACTREPDMEPTFREYINKATEAVCDIRGVKKYHDPIDYHTPQALAQQLRTAGEQGIWYNSVRNVGGECVALFRPKAMTIPKQGKHVRMVWSGSKQAIVDTYLVKAL